MSFTPATSQILQDRDWPPSSPNSVTKELIVQSSPAPTSTISISRLRADLKGRVIAPDDAGYDEARTIFPGGIDRRPYSSVLT